jgi:hypothetical protein
MSILGFKTMPVDHPLHRVYHLTAAVVGTLLAAFGLIGLILGRDHLIGIRSSAAFCVLCLAVGVVLLVGAVVGGNLAAHLNAWVGAFLVVAGLINLLLMPNGDANVLNVEMSSVSVMFVAGMVLLAAGFYGQVGASAPFGQRRTAEGSGARDSASARG